MSATKTMVTEVLTIQLVEEAPDTDAKNPHSTTSSCGGMTHRAKSWGEIKNFSFIWNSALFSHQNLLVAFLCSGLRMERTSNLNDRLQNITWHLINNADRHLSLWARLRILTVVSSRSPVSPSNKNVTIWEEMMGRNLDWASCPIKAIPSTETTGTIRPNPQGWPCLQDDWIIQSYQITKTFFLSPTLNAPSINL